MRRSFLATSGVLLVLALGVPALLSVTLPEKVHEQTEAALVDMGFSSVQIGSSKNKAGAVVLRDIKLDEKGFSTIERVTARYAWSGLISGRLIKRLTITGLSLTGESAGSGGVAFSGWDISKADLGRIFSGIKTVEFESGNIDLLLDSMGGVNLKYDLEISRDKNNHAVFQGSVHGEQKQFSAMAKMDGYINRDGRWHADLVLDQGKMDLESLKASRINGAVQIDGKGMERPEIMIQLAAGGMNFMDLPWHNVSATINTTPEGYAVFAGGGSVGRDGVEFAASFESRNGTHNYSGSVHTKKLSDLFGYLQTNHVISGKAQYPDLLDKLSGLTFDFHDITPSENNEEITLNYFIRDDKGSIDVKGYIAIDTKNKKFSGNLSMPSAMLSEITADAGETGKAYGFSGGTLLLNGKFQTDYSESLKTTGFLEALVRNATANIGILTFHNINGDISFRDIAALSTVKGQKFSFMLPLNNNIKQKGSARFSVAAGKSVTIDDIKIDIFGGTIKSLPLRLEGNKPLKGMVVSLENIDLYALSQQLGIAGLFLSGSLKGALPLQIKDGALYVHDGTLSSSKPGVIRYISKNIPAFLQGDDLQLETAHMALENYHYDFFELRLEGPLSEDLKIVFSARGSNPDLFEGRPIALNLTMDAPAKELFKNISAKSTP